jgi:hypothetical protein
MVTSKNSLKRFLSKYSGCYPLEEYPGNTHTTVHTGSHTNSYSRGRMQYPQVFNGRGENNPKLSTKMKEMLP